MTNIPDEIRSLGIDILRFDGHYIEIALTYNGSIIARATADVPAYEIREGCND